MFTYELLQLQRSHNSNSVCASADHHTVKQAVASHIPGTAAHDAAKHGTPTSGATGATHTPTASGYGTGTGAGTTGGTGYGSTGPGATGTGVSSGTTGYSEPGVKPTAGQKIASLIPGTGKHVLRSNSQSHFPGVFVWHRARPVELRLPVA